MDEWKYNVCGEWEGKEEKWGRKVKVKVTECCCVDTKKCSEYPSPYLLPPVFLLSLVLSLSTVNQSSCPCEPVSQSVSQSVTDKQTGKVNRGSIHCRVNN
jgi:hypothetical protein